MLESLISGNTVKETQIAKEEMKVLLVRGLLLTEEAGRGGEMAQWIFRTLPSNQVTAVCFSGSHVADRENKFPQIML